jgi:predicted transcriptional regulator
MTELGNRSETPVTDERVALMPIHPRYANAILDGIKGAEFRKRRLAPDIRRVVIYATAPISRIVGEFTIGATVVGSPQEIWRDYGDTGEISEPDFHSYFAGRDTAVALVVTGAQRYAEPLALADLSPRPAVPQSAIYLAGSLFVGR